MLFSRDVVNRIQVKMQFQERIFSCISIMATIALVILLLEDLALGTYKDVVIVICSLVYIPGIAYWSIRTKVVDSGTAMEVGWILVVIMPGMFFFSGGYYGSFVLWSVISILYIGLILSGILRVIMLLAVAAGITVDYFMVFRNPFYVVQHNVEAQVVEAWASTSVLMVVVCVIVLYVSKILTRESQNARRDAKHVEELNRAQNKFFSNMSHEIRTPINSILGLNELILRNREIPEEVASNAENIQRAGRMLLTIINDILDMSKIESGEMEILPVVYNVGDILSDVVNMVWNKAEEKGLLFKVDVDPAMPKSLLGDEVRIKQVIINLLNNAIKYTRQGSVTLKMEAEKRDDKSYTLVITVADTGMGMKKEAMENLFDAFKRLDGEKNRNIEGTGLGLSIVKQLVEMMKGEVTVNSLYSKGSTFIVKLPQTKVNNDSIGEVDMALLGAGSERAMYSQSFEAPKARILLVDDNEMNLMVETKLLKSTKVQIDTACNGIEAVAMSGKVHYDVILMDHLMPEMDGIQALKAIRSQKGNLNLQTPVIILTANAGSENMELYRNSGFDGYMMKPVSGKELEYALITHIPREKLEKLDQTGLDGINVSTETSHVKKIPIGITTSSVADIPTAIMAKTGIATIPYLIKTEGGEFFDDEETVSYEILDYMVGRGREAKSDPPSVEDFENFFSMELDKASQIIHIASASKVGMEYQNACEAAKSFGTVHVFDSGMLTSAVGLLALTAYQMTQRQYDMERLLSELEEVKSRMHCGCMISDTSFMLPKGNINKYEHQVCKTLMLHPSVVLKGSRIRLNRMFWGYTRVAWKNYIAREFRKGVKFDKDILFVCYVGLTPEQRDWLEEEIRKKADFRYIMFKQASSAISINCGPGSFGIIYTKAGGQTYDVSRLFYEQQEEAEKIRVYNLENSQGPVDYDKLIYDSEESGVGDLTERLAEYNGANSGAGNWRKSASDSFLSSEMEKLGLDGEAGLKNCGSEEGYLEALETYYQAALRKADEIQDFYDSKDIDNYVIKVHALKSSSRIIGAMELGQMAEDLEMAGKSEDREFIREHTQALLDAYRKLQQQLKELLDSGEDDFRSDEAPELTDEQLTEILSTLEAAALDMDIDLLEETYGRLKGYRLEMETSKLAEEIKAAIDDFDYDLVAEICRR